MSLLFLSKRSDKKGIEILIVGSIYFLAVAEIQYKIRPDYADSILAMITLAFCIFLIVRKYTTGLFYVLYPVLLIFSAAVLNYREYHNLYHAVPFESFIRGKYTLTESELADKYIDFYKLPDTASARENFNSAVLFDGEDDLAEAGKYFDKAIDLNPDNAVYYDRRGLFKLGRNELISANIFAAMKDFNRSIKLDSTFGQAYFHRGQCYQLLSVPVRAINDFRRSMQLDPTIDANNEIRDCNYHLQH